jgi:hypothetical protein
MCSRDQPRVSRENTVQHFLYLPCKTRSGDRFAVPAFYKLYFLNRIIAVRTTASVDGKGPLGANSTASPKLTRVPPHTPVDPTAPPDKITERLIWGLEHFRVPQHARPFAPHPIIHLFRISGAENYRRKWIGNFWHWWPLQPQRPLSVLIGFAFVRPPTDQLKNFVQIVKNSVSVSGRLIFLPLVPQAL